MNASIMALPFAAGALGALAAGCMVAGRLDRTEQLKRRKSALAVSAGEFSEAKPTSSLKGAGLRYAEKLTRHLYSQATVALSPVARSESIERTRAGRRFLSQALAAGCDKDISAAGFCEAQFRLALMGFAAGALVGVLLSIELGVVLGLAGLVVGYLLPARSLGEARKRRAIDAERHLSEMLEVVSLGLRSGLSFDLSFALYGSHFEGEFAQACEKAYRRWALGLMTREESLDYLARSYDCEQFGRVVDSIVRSLRLGTSLAGVLEDAASQARASYRASLEERVAKAPVKMMLPTGALILPAMLLMVMGPVLLELAGGF